ncbi:hypothetical protein FOQG_04214 [Fusarium oxysporum f. sp. raphani 54005]|uniref:Uncharacterized protein n=2 Tax=Fusarium TaxID=5506 RepID=X0CSZ1_FUSOX|nr:hypothetical protein FOQG_04214 [Fusarium oxysporum f. sp. raphani 54005]
MVVSKLQRLCQLLHVGRHDAIRRQARPVIGLQGMKNGWKMSRSQWLCGLILHVHGRGVPRGPSSWDFINAVKFRSA